MAMTHPDGFYTHFGMTREDFLTFQDQGNGIFIAVRGFSFVHAVLTTRDCPATIATITGTRQTVQGSSAGDLWQKCTRRSISKSTCAVQNCTNPGCTDSHPCQAGATAHVYLTSQTSDLRIEYMVLMPTCCACNNHKQCSNCNTNYPQEGQEANVLLARPGTEVIFIRIHEDIAQYKGDKGRGKGQGGTFGEPYSRDYGKGKSGGPNGGKGSGKGGYKGSTPY